MPGVLAGLLSKLAGLGTLAKAAVAAVTAAVTMTVAGGATGVLPLPGGHSDPAAVVQGVEHTVTTVTVPSVSASTSAAAGAESTGVYATAGVSAPGATSTTSGASVGSGTTGVTGTAKVSTSTPAATPAALTLTTLPALPPCVKDLIPAKGTTPDPATFLAKLRTCIQSLLAAHVPVGGVQGAIGSTGLPADVKACISSALTLAPTTGASTTIANPAALFQSLAACLPAGSIPGLGSIPGIGSTPTTGATTHHTTGR